MKSPKDKQQMESPSSNGCNGACCQELRQLAGKHIQAVLFAEKLDRELYNARAQRDNYRRKLIQIKKQVKDVVGV